MQCIQHKGVFDVPEVRDGESNAFQQEAIIDIVPINVEDNVKYCMGDIEAKVQLKATHGQLLVDLLDEIRAMRANLEHFRRSPPPPPFEDGF